MAKVITTHLSKVYPGAKDGEVRAVDDVNLEIADGEFFVLAGPAGSGKTSVLRLIAGLEQVSQGEIFIGEKRVNDVSPKDRDVALVRSHDMLYPHLTVKGNLGFGLKMRAFAKAEIDRRVREAATVFGLEDILERRPDALSAEERLRVALARAAVRQPKVILLDDPLLHFGGCRAQAQAEITRIHQRLQTTMIYAASNQAIAMSMADSVAIMNTGRVQQQDTPATLYQQPANSFVAGFLGHPPMNLVQGTLRQQGESVIFQEAEGGSLRARLPSGIPTNLKDSSGRPVLLGIRPEEIELSDTQQPSKSDENFPALVDLVEPLGAETHLHLQTGAHTLVSRMRRSLARGDAGQRRRFVLRLERVRLFDPETTVAVT